jgi:hypothetical protein
MQNRYMTEITQHVEDCKALGQDVSELAFSIIQSAENYTNEEVVTAFSELPEMLKSEIQSIVNDYKETGEYYVISSTGVMKDMSNLMGRLSRLI